MRRLNVKLLFGLVSGAIGLTIVLFVVHWLQQGSIARAFLTRADHAEKEDRPAQMATYISRYLELEPDDLEQRARLGRVLSSEQLAVTPKAQRRAVFVLEQVLRKDPDRHDLRVRLVRLALQLDKLPLAGEHLEIVKTARPNDGEVEDLYAQLATARKNYDEAAVWFRKAIQHAPQQVDSYVRLAELLRRHLDVDKDAKVVAEADKVMDALVARNGDNFQAHLARWRYWQQWAGLDGAPAKAAANVTAALKLAPEDADVLLAAAELAQAGSEADKKYDEARKYLEQGRQRYPHDVRMVRQLALLELRQGKRSDAVACLRSSAPSLTGEAKAEVFWTLANVLLDGGQVSEAQAVVAQMGKIGATVASLDYLNARLHIARGNFAEAARLLDRTRPHLSNAPELSTQVDLLLAQCFEQLDDPSAQLTALGRVVSRDPASLAARLNMGAALSAAGRIEDALSQFRKAATLPGAPVSVDIDIARLLVLRELQRSATERSPASWKKVEEALTQAEKSNPDTVELTLLRADVLVAQDKKDEARTLLTAAKEKKQNNAQLWAALAGLEALDETKENVARAAALFDEAQPHVGDTAEWRLVRARFWAGHKGADAVQALGRLVQGLDKFKQPERARLLSELAVAYYRLGRVRDASDLWARLAQEPQNKTDVRLRLLLFDLALQAEDDAAMQRVAGELRQIEGEQGTLWRYTRAVRLTWLGRKGKTDGLEEAGLLLNTVASRRQEWPAVLIAKAELEEVKSNFDQAITDYRRAVNLGEHNPRVIRQLVQLLYRQQRYDEADQQMRLLQKEAPRSPELQALQRLAVDISLQNQDAERAVRLALDAVSSESKDWRDHLWQGQVLAASRTQDKQAEAELRRAVELADNVPETWVALVQFQARQNNVEAAEKTMAEAEKKLPADKAPLALGQCYEALGRLDAATREYETALAAAPQNVAVLRSVTAFYLRVRRLAAAEPLLRQLAERKVDASVADAAWGRRQLALALASSGDYRRLPDALALVGLRLEASGRIADGPLPKTDDALEEQRVRAQVLAMQPWREPRKKAITVLEQLSNRRTLLADDQFLLAQLYESDGAWPKARDLLRLLTGPARNPIFLARYAQSLIARKDLDEAERCIKHLEELERAPGVQRGALGALDLRAQLLEARGDGAKAIALLQEEVKRPGAGLPQAILLLKALARQKRFTEALQLCEKLREAAPELSASVTVGLLRASRAGEAECAPVERWVRELCDKKPKSADLWLRLADLQDLRGKYDDVETLCRRVLEIDERNLTALNNLAWLLSQKPDRAAEALALVNRAIELVGPRAELLDTRATVQMALGQNKQAIADLEAANADAPAPSRYFYLAQAQRLANNKQEAAVLLKKATSAGLKAEELRPVERVAFLKLVDELEQH